MNNDVRAVMDYATAADSPFCTWHDEAARKLAVEACAAAAELIEADKSYDDALTSWDALIVTAAKQRRAEALARVQGGAK